MFFYRSTHSTPRSAQVDHSYAKGDVREKLAKIDLNDAKSPKQKQNLSVHKFDLRSATRKYRSESSEGSHTCDSDSESSDDDLRHQKELKKRSKPIAKTYSKHRETKSKTEILEKQRKKSVPKNKCKPKKDVTSESSSSEADLSDHPVSHKVPQQKWRKTKDPKP